MKIKINALSVSVLLVLVFFITGSVFSQEQQKPKQTVEIKAGAKTDTAQGQPPVLWITKFIQSLHLETWSLSASFGSNLFYGDIRQFDWFPVSKKYVADKLVPDKDEYVIDRYKVVDPATVPSERKWGGAFSLNKRFNAIFAAQAQYVFGNLGGMSYKTYISSEYDENGKNLVKPYHNDYFTAKFHEMALNLNITINKIIFPNQPVGRFTAYLTGGIGLMTFTSKLYDLKTGVQENDPAGLLNPKNIVYKKHVIPEKKTTETSFPVGGGLRYRFLPKWSVYLESTLRNINTDKLDNWDDAVTEHDKYQYTCIGITYNFKALSDSLIDSKLKAKYDLQKKPRESKSKVESRIDSLEKILGDLGHRLGNIEENSKDINDSLKIIEERLVQTVPQTGLNTMMFTPTDAVTQLLVVFFDFNKYDIKEVYRKNIALVARILKSDPGIHVQIIGHADRVGSEKYNMALSKKRAMAVANELKNAYGINPDRVTDIVVKGKSDPLSSKYDDVNRRVDFIFTKPKK